MICFKSINGLSNGRWAVSQTQVSRPKKLFLVEKLRKFLILCYVLITALSRKPNIKNTLAYFLMNFWGTFKSNYSRLWWHNLWWSLQWNVSLETWIFSMKYLCSPIASYLRIAKRNILPWIRLWIPPILTLVQETLPIL